MGFYPALMLRPKTFDPVGTLQAATNAQSAQIRNLSALQQLAMAPERNRLTLEGLRTQNAIAALNLENAPERLRLGLDSARTANAQSLLALQSAQQQQALLEGARAAQRVLAIPLDAAGNVTEERRMLYQAEVDRLLQDGRITPLMHSHLSTALPTDDMLKGVIARAQPFQTPEQAAKTELYRANAASTRAELDRQAAINRWLFGTPGSPRPAAPAAGGGGAAPNAAAPGAAPSGAAPPDASPLGPVTPRPVQLLPVDNGAAVMPSDAASASPAAGTPSSAAAAAPIPAGTAAAAPPPDARTYPGTIFSGANAIADRLFGNGQPAAGVAPQAPQFVPPAGGIERPMPAELLTPGTPAMTAPPVAVPSVPTPALPTGNPPEIYDVPNAYGPGGPGYTGDAAPQVRGWLGADAEPDFVGTPMARGVAPSGPAATGVPATAAPATTSVPAPAAVDTFKGAIYGLSTDQQRAAALLLAAKDYKGLADLFTGSEREARNAAANARGKALGEARAALPTTMQSAGDMIGNIDAVISDPNREYITGWSGMIWANPSGGSNWDPRNWLPTSPGTHTTLSRLAQIQGQAFLQAYQSLRGGGQITEVEGKKATDALTRLADTSQSDEGYLEALNDARYQIWSLANLARRKAGLDPVPYVPNATDRKRLTKISGDADWEKLPSGTPYIDPDGNVKVKR
jgi:hypothetical protein